MVNDPSNDLPFYPEDESGDSASGHDVERAKEKLLMDFNLGQKPPERITIEALRQLIRERPERMSLAIKKWLHPGAD